MNGHAERSLQALVGTLAGVSGFVANGAQEVMKGQWPLSVAPFYWSFAIIPRFCMLSVAVSTDYGMQFAHPTATRND
jgi:hypothetical protein